MASWKDALSHTRQRLLSTFSRAFRNNRSLDDEMLEVLEETLLAADVPVRQVGEYLACLSGAMNRDLARENLRGLLGEALGERRSVDWEGERRPKVVLLVGVNGSGKTTTCAKLAKKVHQVGKKPLLGAGDTFRAAGSEQLKIWADRIGCDVVVGKTGADPAAVAFDAMDAAISRNADVLLMDTAGRMHTKQPLMEELIKVQRALAKRCAGAPDEVWMVLDSTLGQNSLIQAREFHRAVPLTGLIISKLDGTSKAGFLFGVAREVGVPIVFAGLGEGLEDLVPFDTNGFLDALLGDAVTCERP